MKYGYIAIGSKVYFQHRDGTKDLRMQFTDTKTAAKAAKMSERARYLNDVKRQYTAAARLLADVENLPGYVDILAAEQESNYNDMIGNSISRV